VDGGALSTAFRPPTKLLNTKKGSAFAGSRGEFYKASFTIVEAVEIGLHRTIVIRLKGRGLPVFGVSGFRYRTRP
jgi:hypothetical protein